jgi:hypothetical protein
MSQETPKHPNEVTWLAKQLLLRMVEGRTPPCELAAATVSSAWALAEAFYKYKEPKHGEEKG